MLLQKKLERAMGWLKNKSNSEEELEDSIELEKNDLLAIIISALLVFGPIIIFLFLVLLWVAK